MEKVGEALTTFPRSALFSAKICGTISQVVGHELPPHHNEQGCAKRETIKDLCEAK